MSEDDVATLSKEVFRALADRRRRDALLCLLEEDSALPLETLARETAARGRDQRPAAVPAAEIDRVTVLLHHSHVPILADVGLVEYDVDSSFVAPSTRLEELEDVLGSRFVDS